MSDGLDSHYLLSGVNMFLHMALTLDALVAHPWRFIPYRMNKRNKGLLVLTPDP
jgi:hypothetical protein